jgi:hypothetical protein
MVANRPSPSHPCEPALRTNAISNDRRAEFTLASLHDLLGDMALARIHFTPPPGLATEADVVALREGAEGRLCELIEGVLVEKTAGWYES